MCRLGVTNGEKIIKAKAVERLKGDSETTEQRKAVTVSSAMSEPFLSFLSVGCSPHPEM